MTDTLTLEPELQNRLAVLAEREGSSVEEFAKRILETHADLAERRVFELEDDEQRWQKYLETGIAVPFESVRHKVQQLAADAMTKHER